MKRTLAIGLLLAVTLPAERFYSDDPIEREPRPISIQKAKRRKLNEYYDFFLNTFGHPGEQQTPERPIPAQNVNTLGEVPDSTWYHNRHGRTRMSRAELLRGPGDDRAPSSEGPWKVTAAKAEGVTPGFSIEDARGRKYVLKFDPPTNPEMASAADVIGAKFFYALGYNVPQNYIVTFERSRLSPHEKARFTDVQGRERSMTQRDIDYVLEKAARDGAGRYRGMASLYIEGELLGPFRFHAARKDDPNDVVPHEHRRELRGLHVFSAWLGHNDIKSLNTLDSLVEQDGVRAIKHHLIDFGAALGSDSFTAKSPRAGNEYLFSPKSAAVQLLTLGLYVPRWARAKYPHIPAVGRFEYELFEPEEWKPNYPNPAFDNRVPQDTFWAAKQVMAFTDDEIRALVSSGQFSDPRATAWLTRTLIERRNKIGKTYLAQLLPLDRFRIGDARLEFEDLAAKHDFASAQMYGITWSRFDNRADRLTPLPGNSGPDFPSEVSRAANGEYFAASIRGSDPNKTVTVYIRKRSNRLEIVGIERP